MENSSDMKALYIIINAGFTDDIMDIARTEGATGATIMNARGEGVCHASFMGITVDSEKEIILSITTAETAQKIMAAINEKAGVKSPAHSVCFTVPIEGLVGIHATSHSLSQPDSK